MPGSLSTLLPFALFLVFFVLIRRREERKPIEERRTAAKRNLPYHFGVIGLTLLLAILAAATDPPTGVLLAGVLLIIGLNLVIAARSRRS